MIESINAFTYFFAGSTNIFDRRTCNPVSKKKWCQSCNINNNKMPYLRNLKATSRSSCMFSQKVQNIVPVKGK